MNPLDSEEYLAIVRDINKEMPMHTPESVKIPFTYGHMPKNLMETSNKVNEKFLNNNLHKIEEIMHRQPKHSLPLWMRAYQSKYFRHARQFGHDGFFQNHITADLRDLRNIGRQGNTSSWLIPFGKYYYNELSRTGSNYQTGFSQNYRLTMKILAGHPLVGLAVTGFSAYLKTNGAPNAGNFVNAGVWDDTGAQKSIDSSLDAHTLISSYVLKTFSFSSYTIQANDHIGIEYGVQGNSSNLVVVQGDANAAPSNTEFHEWSASGTPGTAVTGALAMKMPP